MTKIMANIIYFDVEKDEQEFLKNANDTSKKMLEKDIMATNIYTLGYQVPKFRNVNLDYTMPIVTL